MNNEQQWYMVFMNGEPLIAENTDSITDYLTAEVVIDFLRLVNPEQQFTIEEVELMPIDVNDVLQ